MVFSETMQIDMDALDVGDVTEYLRTYYPQLLYLKYRKELQYLDVVSSEKISNMYLLYQKILSYHEIAWQKHISKAWKKLREERNKRLQSCDWTQLEDVKKSMPIEISQIWVIYRQFLRDLPKTTTDPFNPAWPTTPLMS
jgi:hypothetical protein